MNWIFLSLSAGLVAAIVSIVHKIFLSKWVKNPVVPVIFIGIIQLICAGLIYFLKGFQNLTPLYVIIGLGAGIFYTLSLILYFYAAKIGEISRVTPLDRLRPLFILILAWIFLGETLITKNYIGMILIVAGAFLVVYNNKTKFKLNKMFYFMVLSSLFFSIYAVLGKYLLETIDYYTVFALTQFGMALSLVPIGYSNIKQVKKYFTIRKIKATSFIVLSALLSLGAMFISLIAASFGPISLVSALVSLQPLFVLVFTTLITIFFPKILKEKIDKQNLLIKFLAVVCIIIGVSLIV